MEKIEIKDNSGDRGYFTIIPNYILNHSTAIDQALYLQMKRIAGEDGHCFATEQTLRKKLGIGRQAFQKSLKYLIDHKWISFVGLTGGKTRPIKTY
ncbi:MAG: helix-turn-helix domain-containing protein, partial [Thaumarchaeota archaeon]|nr:helix-turn-helix domain-containing protein [Nitrososphaerota archaeon]